MPLFSLPDECLCNVLFFLDDRSLYKCLFVNRHLCRLSVPKLWREPFKLYYVSYEKTPLNTLIACLNEDEISLLIPCAINFNDQSPLFSYGKFVEKIGHKCFVQNTITWLNRSGRTYIFAATKYQDCRIQGVVNAVYHMMMRQGSNLQELKLSVYEHEFHINLPKISIFTTHKPGITNLRSLNINIEENSRSQNVIEFLTMVSKSCGGIVNFYLHITYNFNNAFVKPLFEIIKLQPLERMTISFICDLKEVLKKFLNGLEFRSETLKVLIFKYIDFQGIDVSFMSKLEHLECLEFYSCHNYPFKQFETLSKKFHLKDLKLWDCYDTNSNVLINYLCDETLLELSLISFTLKTAKLVKESYPNISFLSIVIPSCSTQYLNSTIPIIICELSSLKVLDIYMDGITADKSLLVRILGNYLTSVEYLSLSFFIDLQSFEYFTSNCKANLKKWKIYFDLRKDYLICIDNYQKVHNSLRVLGINKDLIWTNEELEIIDSLKNQGVELKSGLSFIMLLYY